MRNRLPFLFGMDCWRLKTPLTFFLNQCLRQDIEVMELKLTPEGLVFWSPVTSRRRITSLFQDAECLGTSGVTGFLLHQFHQPLRLFSVGLATALWLFYSHCIVQVSVIGTDPTLQRQIERQLAENGYAAPFFTVDQNLAETIEFLIKESFEDRLGWTEVTRTGSRIQLQFTDKEYVETPQLTNDPIYARKEGMVVRFDVQHGEKKVKINEIVHPGDLLIDNELKDAFEVPQPLYVKGKVYGYTWYTVESSLLDAPDFPLHDALAFFRLLMDCRSQIAEQLQEDEKIIKENVLLFDRNAGTITMKIHYTLLEDLTRP